MLLRVCGRCGAEVGYQDEQPLGAISSDAWPNRRNEPAEPCSHRYPGRDKEMPCKSAPGCSCIDVLVTLQPRPQRYEMVCEKERKLLGFGFHDCHDFHVVLARSSGRASSTQAAAKTRQLAQLLLSKSCGALAYSDPLDVVRRFSPAGHNPSAG
jgi:hypothetical protein